MTETEVRKRLESGGIETDYVDEAVELLISFGFLGCALKAGA